MTTIGLSTGAVARGGLDAAWAVAQRHGVRAVELSALREHELPALAEWARGRETSGVDYVSIHAPSRRETLGEAELVEQLAGLGHPDWPVVVHPGMVESPERWRRLGRKLCLENMDKRSPGRTAAELAPLFAALPEAGFCLDLGHARQVDPSLGVARELLRTHGHRLVQVHLSDVDSRCRHRPLSLVTLWSVGALGSLLPAVPVILEAELSEHEVAGELAMAARCFEPGGARHGEAGGLTALAFTRGHT